MGNQIGLLERGQPAPAVVDGWAATVMRNALVIKPLVTDGVTDRPTDRHRHVVPTIIRGFDS